MSVEDWARRTAREMISDHAGDSAERVRFVDGIVHAFSALLSERAEIAAGKVIAGYFPGHEVTFHLVRAALQAAVTAVTEGDTE